MEDSKFCAFIDILGFKNKIAEDYEEAKLFYQKCMSFLKSTDTMLLEMRKQEPLLNSKQSDVEFAIFSDSVIIYGKDFNDLLFRLSNITSWLNSYGFFFRGGIGYGKHFSDISPTNYLIVSEGLVQAATIESKKAIYPRIVIDEIALNAILSDSNVKYHTLSHYFIQDYNNLWFINPLFLNPDISDIYYLSIKKIKEYEGKDFQNKYIWIKELCNYFDSKYLIRANPDLYYCNQNIQKDYLFYYPAIFSFTRFGDKFNYTIKLNTYQKTFKENIEDIYKQHYCLQQQPDILKELRTE